MVTAIEANAQAGSGDSVIGWRLDDAQRRELVQQFPPLYRNLVADHVTLRSRAADDAPLPQETEGEIVGRADDGKGVEAMVVAIGGSSDRPAPITEKEANAILNRVQEGVDKPRPKVLFEPGEVVRVTAGPFNDFNGVVEQVNYDKNKVRVAVQILGRSTPVELDFGQVEKA